MEASTNMPKKAKESSFYESDYEKNCSSLYKAIENAIVQDDEDYTEIAEFLETGEWSDGTTKGPSADVQAKTWVTRFKTDGVMNKRTVEWSQLPLHLAIVGKAPSNIIGSLVKLYPQALRCTDDQQMLPLHLALRHSADDEIVAFLLMQFSDAVNAKGKNGRTAIDCALRSRSKLRGIILETFVNKTRDRLVTIHNKKITDLTEAYNNASSQLAVLLKETEQNKHLQGDFNRVQAKYEALHTENSKLQSEHAALRLSKDLMEEELTQQLHSQEKAFASKIALQDKTTTKTTEKMTCEMMTERAILQKRIDFLMCEKLAAQETQAKTKIEADKLRKTVEELHKKVEDSKDYKDLKKEVASLQKDFLMKEKYQAKQNIGSIKEELKSTLENTMQDKITRELKDLQKMVKQLERSERGAKTSEDVDGLRTEVEKLRTEVRGATVASAFKVEIAQLRKTVTDFGSIVDVSDITARSNPEHLESMSLFQLEKLKEEFQLMESTARNKLIAGKAEKDILDLEGLYSKIHQKADGKIKKQILSVREALTGMKSFASEKNSHDELITLAKDIDSMRELLMTKEVAVEIIQEASAVKDFVLTTIPVSTGAQKEELTDIQSRLLILTKTIESAVDLEELSNIKAELNSLATHVKDIEGVVKIVSAAKSLKKDLNAAMDALPGKTKAAVEQMVTAVDGSKLDAEHREKLRSTFREDLDKTHTSASNDLVVMMEKMRSMRLELPNDDKSAWNSIQDELNVTKMLLKSKTESVDALLDTIKETIKLIEEEESSTAKSLTSQGTRSFESDQSASKESASAKKVKLSKFFKRFSRYSSEKASKTLEDSHEPGDDDSRQIATMIPPCLSKEQDEIAVCDAASSHSSENLTLPPAMEKIRHDEDEKKGPISDETEMTLSLHQSMSMTGSDTPGSPRALIRDPYAPSTMRKVKSMDPSFMGFNTNSFAPAEITRSLTRLIAGESDKPADLFTVPEQAGSSPTSIPL